MDLSRYHSIAVEVVAQAEQRFIDDLGSGPSIRKPGGDFATEADVALEQLLRRELSRRTGIEVFGEEHGGRYNPDAMWVVDPIDGTSNYAAGNPMCAILVALILDGVPRVAITSIPLLRRRLSAVEKLFVNGEATTPPAARSDEIAQVGFSSLSSGSGVSTHRRLEMLATLNDARLRPRITGSVGVDLAFAAQGIFDAAVSFSPNIWDNAAGVVLARAVGKTVTDCHGEPWTVESRGVVVGTAKAHEVVVGTIKEITQ